MIRFALRTTFMFLIALLPALTLGGSLAQRAVAAAEALVSPPCGEAQFNAALNTVQVGGGGTVTFNCGTATIPFTAEKIISSHVVIDGGGVITLDGGNVTRFFKVMGGGSLTLRGLVLTHGYSGNDYGGAIYVNSGGVLALENSTIQDSATNDWAGGAIIDFLGTVTLTDSLIENNQSSYGALNSTGTLTLLRTTVRNNSATLGGGAMSVGGTTLIRDSQIKDNSAPEGGAIYAGGDVTVQGSVLETNTATRGGAMYILDGGDVQIDDSHFLENKADGYITEESNGGGIVSYGELVIRDSSFEANSSVGYGGAIQAGPGSNDAITQVYTSLFVANEAGERGGAIDNRRGDLTVVNSTFSANSAGTGGAIQNLLGPANLYYVTLTGNNGGVGGVLDQSAAAGHVDDSRQRYNLYHTALAQLGNCAITGTPGPLPHFVSGGHNLAEDDSCTFFMNQPGDLINTPAQLGALADNGGSTSTHLPGPASPLVDGGSCLPDFNTDQRGISRPQGASCDIGAVEAIPASPTATPTSTQTSTPTSTTTASPTASPTSSSTPTATPTATFTPTSTPTSTTSSGETGGGSATPTPTFTPTSTPTSTPTWTPISTPTDTPEPVLQPAQVPGGVTVTINANPTHAYAGQPVTVSGQGATGFSKVRILSIQNGRTVGSQEVKVNDQGAYSLQLLVPSAQAVAPTRLCSAAVGTEKAQLACTDFQVDPMPAGQLQGQISGLSAEILKAQVNLVDRFGAQRYSGPVAGNGSFQMNDIDPGVYKAVVTGQTSKPVPSSQVVVMPNVATQTALSSLTLNPGIRCALDTRTTAYLKLANEINPAGGGGDGGLSLDGVVTWKPVDDSISNDRSVLFELLSKEMMAKSQRDYFGIYVSGAVRSVDFVAYPQTDVPAQSVIFRLIDVDGTVKQTVTAKGPIPYEASLRVDKLSPSQGNVHPKIQVVPVVSGIEYCPSDYPVYMLADPLASSAVKPFGGPTFWNDNRQRYEFNGFMPKGADVQFSLPPNPLPYFGAFDNHFRAGVIFKGAVYENGEVEITEVWADAYARALNADLTTYRRKINLPDQTLTNPWQVLQQLRVDLGSFDIVEEDYVGLPFLHVPVLDLFGLVQVHVASSAGVTYGIKMNGWVKPFVPEVVAQVKTSAEAQAEVGYGLGIIGGVAAVGYSLGLGAALDVPVDITVLPSPDLSVPQACFRINAFARAWAQYLWGIKLPGVNTNPSWKKVLAEYPLGCLGPFAAANADIEADDLTALAEDAPLPSLFASPSVASSPDGRVLSAYVEDRSATNTAQVQILARFQDPVTGAWLAPTPLSNPTHSAVNPVALFAGPDALPVVAWAELPYDAATATTLGNDVDAHLSRQEIFYAVNKNGVWGAPIRLTDDLLIDGMPTAAGSAMGAVLAWTRDTDADHLTRTDQRIAVSLFDNATAAFGPPQLLTGPRGGMNTDVRAALAPDGTPNLVWVNDADGVLDTGDDRRLTWAHTTLGEQGVQPEWVILNPQPLPPRVDSPAITIGPDGQVELAFLVRQAAQDGSVPLLGPNGALWSARLSDQTWSAAPVHDEAGDLVFAEQPVLSAVQGEKLLAFRRFSPEGLTNASLGQISLTRSGGDGRFTAPIYLTDAPAQNWQPALTINPANRQAVILKVARYQTGLSAASSTGIAESQAIMAASVQSLSSPNLFTVQDPVESVMSMPTADPALDPLIASASVVPAGQTIFLTVNLRNVGRDPATAMTVTLYQGSPGNGVSMGAQSVVGPLDLNATVSLTFPVTALGGTQSFYANVTTQGGNASGSNDQVSLTLGIPSPPQMVTVSPGVWTPEALEIAWTVPEDERPAGYRILRGPSAEGPFELVGESAVSGTTDTLVERGTTYCYVIQAHNNGTLSAMSETVCGQLEQRHIYLPTVMR